MRSWRAAWKKAAPTRAARAEFHANKGLTDQAKIDKEIEKAVRGVQQMMMYTSLDPSASEWCVQMEQNPMPAPEGKAGPQL